MPATPGQFEFWYFLPPDDKPECIPVVAFALCEEWREEWSDEEKEKPNQVVLPMMQCGEVLSVLPEHDFAEWSLGMWMPGVATPELLADEMKRVLARKPPAG